MKENEKQNFPGKNETFFWTRRMQHCNIDNQAEQSLTEGQNFSLHFPQLI